MGVVFGTKTTQNMFDYLRLPSLEEKDIQRFDVYTHGNSSINPVYRDAEVYIPYYTLDKYLCTIDWDMIKDRLKSLGYEFQRNKEIIYPGLRFYHRANLILNNTNYITNRPYICRIRENEDGDEGTLNDNEYKVENFEEMTVEEIPDYLESIEEWLCDKIESSFSNMNKELEKFFEKEFGQDSNYVGFEVTTSFHHWKSRVHFFKGFSSHHINLKKDYAGMPLDIVIKIRFLT